MTNQSRNPYAVLGVPPTASASQVRLAYRRLAKQFHPDRHSDAQATERMQRINQAWETLSSPAAKARYDAQAAAPPAAASPIGAAPNAPISPRMPRSRHGGPHRPRTPRRPCETKAPARCGGVSSSSLFPPWSCSLRCSGGSSHSRSSGSSSSSSRAPSSAPVIEGPMNQSDWLADQFESQRGHLRGVAYRMLGSVSEADDVSMLFARLARGVIEIGDLAGAHVQGIAQGPVSRQMG